MGEESFNDPIIRSPASTKPLEVMSCASEWSIGVVRVASRMRDGAAQRTPEMGSLGEVWGIPAARRVERCALFESGEERFADPLSHGSCETVHS